MGIKKKNNILQFEDTKDCVSELSQTAMTALTQKDPISAIDFIQKFRFAPSAIRDSIFLDCFRVFLLNSSEYDPISNKFIDKNLTSFVQALAETSPNPESEYAGDPERLNEYAKRIIKVIDDCGTIQKAYYIACLARAVKEKYIDANKFFKFSHCICSLTIEDLLYLNNNIAQGLIDEDNEYIDDFRALGLLKEVSGGFEYTLRAYELKKYALDYEGNVQIPDTFTERLMARDIEPISAETIDAITGGLD